MIRYWKERKELERYQYLQVVGYDDARARELRVYLSQMLQKQGEVILTKVSTKFGIYEYVLKKNKVNREKLRRGIPVDPHPASRKVRKRPERQNPPTELGF